MINAAWLCFKFLPRTLCFYSIKSPVLFYIKLALYHSNRSKELTINTQLIELNALAKLNAAPKKLDLEWD